MKKVLLGLFALSTVACGACQTACPKNVIAMLPEKNIVTVTCSSKDKGVDAKKN